MAEARRMEIKDVEIAVDTLLKEDSGLLTQRLKRAALS